MTALPAPRRQAHWARGVLLVLALAASVIIHHSVAHVGLMGSGHTAMPAMTATGMTSPVSPMAADTADHRAETVEATDAGSGCAGDQMCVASGVAKTPSLAHPIIATQAYQLPAFRGTLSSSRHDIAPAPPPGALRVLRI